MKFLLLNQTFHPDVAASGQYLADAARALVERGHDVTVITGRRSYDTPRTVYPPEETWEGVRILRVGSTWFAKNAKWKRALNFGTFMAACALRVALVPRPDVVLALTSPPLLCFLAAWFAKLRHSRFVYWVMDLNPDEAIAAGWLRNDSTVVRALVAMSRFSFNRADRVIALDHFMRDRIIAKGIPPSKVTVSPLWHHCVFFDPKGREQVRRKHRVDGKFVVMYSGNHSPCHPLHTLLEAARQLETFPDIVFCFIGWGAGFSAIQGAASKLKNVVCLPCQPESQLAATLSAADLQIVVMGDPFVGLVHPCKIYNLLSVGAPILYIGPKPSHVTDLLDANDARPQAAAGNHWSPTYISAPHGHPESLAKQIRLMRDSCTGRDAHTNPRPLLAERYSPEMILPILVEAFESA